VINLKEDFKTAFYLLFENTLSIILVDMLLIRFTTQKFDAEKRTVTKIQDVGFRKPDFKITDSIYVLIV